ncbi:MAG: septum formation initiator family protein [bacterium]
MKPKKTARRKVVLGIFAGVILYFMFGGDYNIYNLLRYHQKEKKLQTTIQKVKDESQALTAEIEMLKTDSTYIEKVAREKYGMARPEEIIFKEKDHK